MNKKIILLLLAILLIFGATSAVSAADISVSDVADNNIAVDAVSVANDAADIASVDATINDDENISDLSAPTKEDDTEINSVGEVHTVTTYDALKTALNNAQNGDIINITANITFTTGQGNLNVAKSVTIISENGAIIDANGKNRTFNITANNVNILGLTFKNGYANTGRSSADGGAIDINCTNVTIKDCIFENNNGSRGGAIKVESTSKNINIENCEFIDNHVSSVGGAIRFNDNTSNCIIKDCYFFNNSATNHGGAICSYCSNVTLINSTFESNSGGKYSGAFHSHASGVTWIDCNFTGNKANGTGSDGYGGAVSLLDQGNKKGLGFNFTGCVFEDNYANNYGGAIEVKANHSSISNSVFINNEAKNTGGAININGNYTDITGVNMTGNKAINGSGIYINGPNATVSDSNIYNNTATTNGAGVYINGNNATVNGVNMTGNKAINGSGVYITGNNAVVSNSNISANNASYAGAAAWIKGDNTKILNSDIEYNYADKIGGAIFINGSRTLIDNSTFFNNTVNHIGKNANGLGGAFYVSGNNTNISYSTFDGNIACNGSAIYADGSISVINDTFIANQARIFSMPIESNGTHVNSTLVGGDNILNAIYYSGNLTKFNFTGTITKNGTDYYYENVHPNESVENSSGGIYPYRDPHEEGQMVNFTLMNGSGIVESFIATTDLGGKVLYNLTEDVIDSINRGNWYIASLYHAEDEFYTELSNTTVLNAEAGLLLSDMTFMVGNASDLIYGAYMSERGEMIPDALVQLNITAPNGTVIYRFNATTCKFSESEPVEGQFWVNLTDFLNTLPIGVYKLTGMTTNETGGRPVYANATITVTPVATSIVAENITYSYPYENHTITVNVTDLVNATKLVNEGVVEIELPNGTKVNATVVDGVATFEDIFSDRTGNFTLPAKYYGDEYYNDCNTTYIWNVVAIPAPTVEKTSNVSGKTVKKDDLVEYTITVTNNVDIPVTYTIVDTLPDGLVFVETGSTAGYTRVGQKVTWTITLGPNDTKEITLVARVNASNTQLNNTVSVGNGTSNVTTNVTNNDTIVEKLANITVTKVANVTFIQYNDLIGWTIVVTNNGPDAAENVTVTEILVNGLELDSVKYISTGNYDEDTGVWTVGDLNKGGSATLIISTKVTTNEGNVTNAVNVNSPTPDVDNNGTVVPDVNKTENVTIPVTPLSSPIVVKNASKTIVISGDVVEYHIVIENNNTVPVTYLVNDTFPEGLIFIDNDTYKTTAGYIRDGDSILWNVTIAAKGKADIVVYGQVNTSDATLTNNVTVTNDTAGINTSSASVVVGNLANITVTKVLNDTTITQVNRGDVIVWKIVVTNNGPDAAVNVTGKEVIGDSLEYVGYEAEAGTTYNPDTGVWTIGTLDNGTSAVLYITTRVVANDGTIANTITITSPTADVDENGTVVPEVNKTITNDTIPVDNLQNPTVSKTVEEQVKYVMNDTITYTIVVSNPNNITINYTVVDTLPEGLVFVADGSTTGYYLLDQTVTWTVVIAPHSNATITLKAIINASNVNLTNVVVAGNTTRNVTGTDNETITVDKLANITVSKALNVTVDKVYIGDELVWKIVVTNNGPDTAEAVKVIEHIGNALEYVTYETTTGTYDEDTGVWTVGDLTNGTSAILYITTLVTENSGNVDNAIEVLSNTSDVDENGTIVPEVNKTDNVTVPIESLLDPTVSKTVEDRAKYVMNDTITYTIVVSNPNNITINYTVVDTLPVGLVYNGSNIDASVDGQKVTWIVEVAPNSNATITLKAIINASNVNLTNVVVAGNTTRNVTGGDNETITVDKLANITVTKVLNDTTITQVNRGDVIVWKIVVTNNGPDAAVNVTGKEVIGDSLEYVGYEAEAGTTYNPDTGVWTIGTLDNGTSAVLYITTRVVANNGTIANTVTITSPTSDVDENGTVVPEVNKTITNDTIPVDTVVDPIVNKTVEVKDKYVMNDTITYTITVTNPNNISIVYHVVDTLPEGLVFVADGSTTGYYLLDQTVTWDIAIDAKETATITLKALINASNINLTNNVIVGNDTREINNTDNVTITVDNLANITIGKITNVTDVDTVAYGDIIRYIIDVINYGPDMAENVTVIDVLPEGLEFVSYNASTGTYDPDTGVWTIGNLDNNTNAVLFIDAKVNISSGEVINIANVLSPTSDIDENGTIVPSVNKTDNVTTTVEKLDVIITIPDVNGTAGEKVVVNITVIDERGNPVNNENLTVTLPDGSVVTVPIVDGIAQVEFILPPAGTYKIYAALEGSDYYNDAYAEGNVVSVNNETPTPAPKGIPMQHTGNPIAILALILMVLSGCTYRFKKE